MGQSDRGWRRPRARPLRQPTAQARRGISASTLTCSFCNSGNDAHWNFINVLEESDRDAAGAFRGLERERIRRGADAGLPVPKPQRVLGRGTHRLARDDVFARHRSVADLNPDLPVGVEVSKGKMLTLYALDNAAANMLGLQHPRHKLVVGLRQQEIRT